MSVGNNRGRPKLSLNLVLESFRDESIAVKKVKLLDGSAIERVTCALCPNSSWTTNTDRLKRKLKDHIYSEGHKQKKSAFVKTERIHASIERQTALEGERITKQLMFERDFVLKLYESGLPLTFVETPLVSWLGDYLPQLRALASRTTLRTKHLPEVITAAF